MKNDDNWTVEIYPSSKWFELNLKEIWYYRDLFWLFVRRDIVTTYKQTILGPLWFVIQPVFTTLMFTLVFNKIANLSTNEIPPVAFYLSGITIWGYFSDCLNRTSNVFVVNQHIFGKVYFPRILVPTSIVVSTMVRFSIQFIIFLFLWSYYYYQGKIEINPVAFLLPLIVVNMALLSLGFGMIFSSLTTKYRDLQYLLSFMVQLWMYATPIIYPLSSIPAKYASYISLNPVAPLIEATRYGFLGQGMFSWHDLAYSLIFAIVILVIGAFTFTKVEKSFMDTV